ncbi:MAG TPA: hypothetical protein VK631_12100 [Solirubrobacteraceae bacterium]|nr:hypothetical protein [Solirubrobacteraceae bacterium]
MYLAALVGGAAVLWLSDLVSDDIVTPSQLADVTDRGPAFIGLFAAAAIALGFRSGSDGGPVSLEAGDVRFLMMAPVPRRAVLLRPVVQRCRSMAFAGVLVGGIAGQLASKRLPGSAVAWATSGACAGAVIGLAFVATATIGHALGVPRWIATAVGALVVVVQIGAAAWEWPGPGDGIGSFAMWGLRTHPVDLVAVAAVVVATGAALWLADRLRLEPLTRRADLVSQLRFAVTMQDLRTVVLLRRQLRGERPRTQPWVRLGRSGSSSATRAVWQRDVRGLARYPGSRLLRMAVLAAVAGLCTEFVLEGTTPLLIGIGIALYLLGLDAIEPMSQEIDHPDFADGMPNQRGWLLARHFAAPAIALVPFAVVGAAAIAVIEPAHALAALALALPVTWAGAAGSIVSVVRDAPNPVAPSASAAAVPPEFAGFTSSLRFLVPIVVSSIASLTALAMREDPTAGTAVRMAVLDVLVLAALGVWVLRRDEWSKAWRKLLEGGRKA